jgi:abortive infection bacteriophage resistance protein
VNSREDKSAGIFLKRLLENPNSALTHDLKKNVGPMRYRNNNKTKARTGNKSMKNEKNRNSDTKKSEPGNPRKISKFVNEARNNLGHR